MLPLLRNLQLSEGVTATATSVIKKKKKFIVQNVELQKKKSLKEKTKLIQSP